MGKPRWSDPNVSDMYDNTGDFSGDGSEDIHPSMDDDFCDCSDPEDQDDPECDCDN